jgi:hypothetical protein
MINIRPFNRETDVEPLKEAIEKDTLHPGAWTVEHFTDPTLFAEVVEDEQGPVIYARFTKTLRISCGWADPENTKRNGRPAFEGVADTIQKAKASGYTEVIVLTNHPPLAEFLKKFGFKEAKGEYLLQI